MEQEIEIAEKQIGWSSPEDCVAFHPGLAGEVARIGNRQLFLWPVEELAYYNEGYDVEASVPRLILFGTADWRLSASIRGTIQIVPMDWREAIPCGRTLGGFLQRLRRGGRLSTTGEQRAEGEG